MKKAGDVFTVELTFTGKSRSEYFGASLGPDAYWCTDELGVEHIIPVGNIVNDGFREMIEDLKKAKPALWEGDLCQLAGNRCIWRILKIDEDTAFLKNEDHATFSPYTFVPLNRLIPVKKLVVGDLCVFAAAKDGISHSFSKWKILAIDGETAWIKTSIGTYASVPFSTLKPVSEP